MENEIKNLNEVSNSSDTQGVRGKKLSELLKSEQGGEPILSCKNLHVSFKTDEGLVHAVRGVSFDLYKGETLCIVGESGSGKSVTSKTIMGILSASAVIEQGSIIYEGEDLTKIDESEFHRIRGHKIGMIFQDPLSSLNPIMKVGKQITEAMLVSGNLVKRMKDSYISKEFAAFKNCKIRKKNVYIQCDHALDVSDEIFNRQILALERKIDEAVFETDQHSKGSAEYEEAMAKVTALKNEVKLQKKDILAKKKAEHQRISLENKAKKKEADALYKSEIPALKAALNQKTKEADEYIRNYKAEKKAVYEKEAEELKAQRLFVTYREEKRELAKKVSACKERYKENFKITRKQAKAKALEVMREVGIPQPEIRFKQYPFEFSGGMRQRIVIAIALTANPDVLICDEPTTALDVTIQAQILELINKLKRERNMSIIFITHDLGVVANMADRVAVMYAGKIVEVGTAYEIFYDPRHPYTWALLSSIPDLDSKEKLEAIPGTPPYLLNPPKGDAFAARNKYAMQIDFEQEPPFFKISDTHYAATWLLDERAPKAVMPKIVSNRIEKSLERAGVEDDR